jgi:fucose 4-O-acetylase-like acetyltransferase
MTTTKSKIERVLTIDALKGFAIFLVVLGHTIQYNNLNNFDNNPIFRFIYSFHMPLFIFLSGYIAFYSIPGKNIKEIVIKKTKLFIVPFLSWYFIISYLSSGIYQHENLIDYSNKLIKSPDYGLWFLWILFWCFILLTIFLKLTNLIKIKNVMIKDVIVAIILMVILYYLPINILGRSLLAWHFPFFILGFIIAKNKDLIMRKFNNNLQQFCVILFFILLIFWQRTLDPIFINQIPSRISFLNKYIVLGYRYLVALLGINFSYILIKNVQKTKIFDILKYIGYLSFDIYVLQFYFLIIISNVNESLIIFNGIIFIIFSVVSIFISLSISKYIFSKNNILSFLFLGR